MEPLTTSKVLPKSTKIKEEPGNFNDCISAFAKNLSIKSSACEELQELFFKLANTNKTLPHNTDYATIDSFISILITLISDHYGEPIALEALKVLLNYLKYDSRVAAHFYPTRELILQLGLDKYLASSEEPAKHLVMDFLCFLTRCYEEIDYSDLTSDPKLIPRVRKAELERTWADIESLAANQENIVKVSEQNQQTTSKAFTELFAYVEDIRKNYELTVAELKKDIVGIKIEFDKRGKLRNSEGRILGPDEPIVDLPLINRIENIFNDKVVQVQKLVDRVMGETINLGNRCDENAKRLTSIANIADGTAKKTLDIITILNTESQLIKDTRGILLTRISNVENEMMTLSNGSLGQGNKEGDVSGKEIANLRIDSIRNQIDVDILPKLSEIQIKLNGLNIRGNAIKDPEMAMGEDLLFKKLNEKGVDGISGMIHAGMETISSEVRAYKKLLDTLKEKTIKLQESQEILKTEVQKQLDMKNRPIENALNGYIKENNIVLKTINDKLKLFTTELEDCKREFNEITKNELKTFSSIFSRYEQRFVQLEADIRNSTLKLNQIEDLINTTTGKLNKLNDASIDTNSKERMLLDKVQEVKLMNDTIKKGNRELYDDIMRHNAKLKEEMQEYFNSSLGYVQHFTNLHALDKVAEIKSLDTSYTTKLNCLEWLIRYHQYISIESSSVVIQAFNELIQPSRIHERKVYSSVKHTSDIMNQLVKSLHGIKKGHSSEELSQALSDAELFMAILEIALINDQNVETGLTLGLLGDIIQYLQHFMSSYKADQCNVILKLTVRCLTYCLRSSRAADILVDLSNAIQTVVTLIELSKEEEIVANSIKVLRVCLRNDKHYDTIVQKAPNLLQVLLNVISDQQNSPILLDEATTALRNYTRRTYVLETIKNPEILEPLCKLANELTPSKHKEYSIAVLKNCCKVDKLAIYIRQAGIP